MAKSNAYTNIETSTQQSGQALSKHAHSKKIRSLNTEKQEGKTPPEVVLAEE